MQICTKSFKFWSHSNSTLYLISRLIPLRKLEMVVSSSSIISTLIIYNSILCIYSSTLMSLCWSFMPSSQGTSQVIPIFNLRKLFSLLSLSKDVHQYKALIWKLRVAKGTFLSSLTWFKKRKVVPPSSPNLSK